MLAFARYRLGSCEVMQPRHFCQKFRVRRSHGDIGQGLYRFLSSFLGWYEILKTKIKHERSALKRQLWGTNATKLKILCLAKVLQDLCISETNGWICITAGVCHGDSQMRVYYFLWLLLFTDGISQMLNVSKKLRQLYNINGRQVQSEIILTKAYSSWVISQCKRGIYLPKYSEVLL